MQVSLGWPSAEIRCKTGQQRDLFHDWSLLKVVMPKSDSDEESACSLRAMKTIDSWRR